MNINIRPQLEPPSPWVTQYGLLIREGGRVLDLACGAGRHTVWLAEAGYLVDALDKSEQALAGLVGIENVNPMLDDLETGLWSGMGRRYDGIVVSRYLYRPILRLLPELLNSGGVLIYETFMVGHEQYGKPSNPNYLLLQDELSAVYSSLLHIYAFEQGEVGSPASAMMQRICATKTHGFK